MARLPRRARLDAGNSALFALLTLKIRAAREDFRGTWPAHGRRAETPMPMAGDGGAKAFSTEDPEDHGAPRSRAVRTGRGATRNSVTLRGSPGPPCEKVWRRHHRPWALASRRGAREPAACRENLRGPRGFLRLVVQSSTECTQSFTK